MKNEIKFKKVKQKEGWNKVIITIIIILVAAILFSLFYTKYEKDCGQDQICFNSAASICRPAKLLIDKEGSTFLYTIKGNKKDDCIILIKIKELNPEYDLETVQLLENKEMTCAIPKSQLINSDFTEKESVIDYCTGPLKESIYELMIKRMYNVLAQNMGPILNEMESVI